MLNLSQIIGELSQIGDRALDRQSKTRLEMEKATAAAIIDAELWTQAKETINGRKFASTKAILLSNEQLCCPQQAVSAPTVYTVAAVDGSQIPVDRHAPLPNYLINIGSVVIHYGTGERPVLTSKPELFYADNEIRHNGSTEEPSFITENQIAETRNRKEISALTGLVNELSDRTCLLALVDGPMVLWAQDPARTNRKTSPAIKDICELIRSGQGQDIGVAGYVSRPANRDVVNTIRMFIELRDGSLSSENDISSLTDAEFFMHVLDKGERSVPFQSTAKILTSYDGDANEIAFFYVNTGDEIARIETPLYDGCNDSHFSLIHGTILDQVNKGHGFPVALTEAHEQAVVRSADRAAVAKLIDNELLRRQIPVSVTRKSLSKRTRPI
jgi:hypothetical protein